MKKASVNVCLLFAILCEGVSGQLNLSALQSSIRDPVSRIVNGEVVKQGAYPFFAFTFGRDLCGGSLIHPDILLTAGHCAVFFQEGAWIGGTRMDGTDSEFHAVDEILIHKEYPGSGAEPHDIALVKLSKRSSNPPVTMAAVRGTPYEGTDVTVIGLGAVREDGPLATQALETNLEVSSFEYCNGLYQILLEEVMFCTKSPPGVQQDSCQGDSGGPLLNEAGELVGLVFFGSGCAKPGIPSVNTRVSGYTGWIADGICTLSSEKPSSCMSAQTPRPAPLHRHTEPPTRPTLRPTHSKPPTPLSSLRPTPSKLPTPSPYTDQDLVEDEEFFHDTTMPEVFAQISNDVSNDDGPTASPTFYEYFEGNPNPETDGYGELTEDEETNSTDVAALGENDSETGKSSAPLLNVAMTALLVAIACFL